MVAINRPQEKGLPLLMPLKVIVAIKKDGETT
jgi:hypothetical protein